MTAWAVGYKEASLSTLTKVFAVLLVFFSIAFTVMTVSMVAQTTNWKDTAQKYEEHALVADTNLRNLIASSASVYRRRCCNVVEYRDRVKNMTIPARGRLVLRWGAGKRRHSTLTSGNGTVLAFKRRHDRRNGRSVLRSGKDPIEFRPWRWQIGNVGSRSWSRTCRWTTRFSAEIGQIWRSQAGIFVRIAVRS